MAKKNRKKELKRKQKLEITTDMSQFGQELDKQITKPRIVERRLLNAYDRQFLALRQFYAEFDNDYPAQEDVDNLTQSLSNGTFVFLKEYQLLLEALDSLNSTKRRKLFREILKENPHSYDAKLQLLIEDTDPADFDYYERLHEFVAETLLLWKSEDYSDYRLITARPYWVCFCFAIDFYLHSGNTFLAVELVEEILRHPLNSFTPNFLSLAFASYLETGQFQKMSLLYQRFMKSESASVLSKDGPLIYMVMADILSHHHEDAEKRLSYLFKMNDEAFEFLANPDWVDDIFEIDYEDAYLPYSADALRAYLLPALDYIEENIALQTYIEHYFESKSARSVERTQIGRNVLQWQKILELMSQPKLKGIRFDMIRYLAEFGIESVTDFKKYTEKEILSIKGIGKVTVEKLKDNGIIFKVDKK
ncbi:hypothetical protein ACVRZD_03810 [Streptococcus hongkongensis]|nr:hypothetical protein NC01_02880 [Streptococcus uberis]